MMRTTIYLPETLHHRLHIASKRKKRSVSKLASDLLDKALAAEEEKNLDNIYRAMEEVEGICKDKITDASTTIDEVLYGEQGAWRGSWR
ncbi:MAG: hypothetical protein MN733_35315 [Nitrososphaera sp.]|nr:hypothetical protein [Nitrososphaera sp.]